MSSQTQERTYAALAAVVAIIVVVAVLLVVQARIPTTGKIKAIGVKVYATQDLTMEVTSIEWGTLSPGEVAEAKIWVKSISNAPADLTLSTENWIPAEAANFITLTWNLPTSQPIQPDEVIAVTLRLSVSQNIVGIYTFTFDIVITASG